MTKWLLAMIAACMIFGYAVGGLVTLSYVNVALQAQQITLGTAVVRAGISAYRPLELSLRRTDAAIGTAAHIVVTIVGTDDRGEVFEYPCTNGCTAMDTAAEVNAVITALNTANLSTRSLWHRIFDALVRDFPERFSGGGTVQ